MSSSRWIGCPEDCGELYLSGLRDAVRRFYVNVIHSVILYASLVWGESFTMYKTYQAPLLRIQQRLALRIIRAYQTVSLVAALLLARIPLLQFIVARNLRIYSRISDLRIYGEVIYTSITEIKKAADCLMYRQWRILFDKPNFPGACVREAILPVFDKWITQNHCNFDYFTTQLITGHGSFSDNLFKIKKVTDTLSAHTVSKRMILTRTSCNCARHGLFWGENLKFRLKLARLIGTLYCLLLWQMKRCGLRSSVSQRRSCVRKNLPNSCGSATAWGFLIARRRYLTPADINRWRFSSPPVFNIVD